MRKELGADIQSGLYYNLHELLCGVLNG